MTFTPVTVRREPVVLPTYHPQPPDRNPMFLDARVYQGSSGRVYPLPFYDRIADHPVPHAWDAVFIENEFISVMLLPALGGRIHRILDKTNGYDAIYYQPVIKPALVGLAGPWASGGIEFNWPQHHRPSTYMPADVHVEEHADGAATVWLSEHDPMARMKGMHGVCLYPGKSYLELKARAYNRTADVQTFLWWANAATRVHEHYQSFFPPDVTWVADHARRSLSTFPFCSGHYYGVDYAARARDGVPPSEQPRRYRPVQGVRPDDLSWYANIPVPTSYMAVGSREDFLGGYDHAAGAGVVHVANHHISPGKKQWTWGNHEFGYAWDRNLTDADEHGEHRPYIELMAGVYTDNQPDFSFLQPGETRTWSQYWYPIQKIGPARHATREGAVSLRVDGAKARIGVAVTAEHANATVTLRAGNRLVFSEPRALSPAAPFVAEVKLPRGAPATELELTVTAGSQTLLRYRPRPAAAANPDAKSPIPVATEPPAPADVATADELHLIGLHLEQYRHATRRPELYWREALRRDPGDARCNLALGRWHLRRGEFADAERHLRASLARLTARNANPYDGEPYYQLGLCLRFLDRDDAAYDALYKATWNQAWQAAAYHALAEIDCCRRDWPAALDHLDRALRLNTDNLRARNLRTLVLRQLGRTAEADAAVQATLALDPLDWWARHLHGDTLTCDTQVRLDLALDHARAGFFTEALALLRDAAPEPLSGTAPLIGYYAAWICRSTGDQAQQARHLAAARAASPDYCFPARLEELRILEAALATTPSDGRAHAYLGHWLYDRRRHREAIGHWETAARLEPGNAVVWRCLGIGYYNILQKPARARLAYERAVAAAPDDARLFYERDQLWKRLRVAPARRLRALGARPDLVAARDDLTVELCELYNHTGRPAEALALLEARHFQPWEGGEGQALGQYVRARLVLGRTALARGDAAAARAQFEAALAPPENLGEVRHLLANQSDLHFELGCACAALGDRTAARQHWTTAATFRGDFQGMSVRAFSEMTYYSALAWEKLGQKKRAQRLLRDLGAYARTLAATPARIDYFATSLPTMLLFADDLAARQQAHAFFLEAQANLGLGRRSIASRLLQLVLQINPNHPFAADLVVGSPR
ncbi:MAG TPA: DUF5107 domain-containing protein [Opitutaceae bacterium]